MKTTHEYTITVSIPCTGDAEHQAEIFAKVREHYVALKAVAVEMHGVGAVAVVRKVNRVAKLELARPTLAVPAAKLAHG